MYSQDEIREQYRIQQYRCLRPALALEPFEWNPLIPGRGGQTRCLHHEGYRRPGVMKRQKGGMLKT